MIITFVGPAQSSFVQNDIAILQRKDKVKIVDANIGRGKSAALALLKLESKSIFSLLRSDILLFWLADYCSFFPARIARLPRKRGHLGAGGFAVTYIREVTSGARV